MTFEHAPSGRAKCRGCGQVIAKGELRFGDKLPNPFAEGEMTHWYHPMCAAYKRPEAMIAGLEANAQAPDRAALERAARASLAQHRLPRIDGAEISPSGQARCRHCKEFIERGTWRIRLVFYEEGSFAPSGFVHVACRAAYFETAEILEHVLYFSRSLGADDREALKQAFEES